MPWLGSPETWFFLMFNPIEYSHVDLYTSCWSCQPLYKHALHPDNHTQEEKGTAGDEMVGWHHWFDGHEFEQALGVGDGQGSLACCSPWSCKELDMTEQLNWTESYTSPNNPPKFTLYSVWGIKMGHELRYLRTEMCRVKAGDLKVSQSQVKEPKMNEQQNSPWAYQCKALLRSHGMLSSHAL